MSQFRLKKINAIAKEGLNLLDENFTVSADEADPHGILVRSTKVDTDEFPSLLAVARAGAGVNNITVDKATEKGICIFNTPGANANAVVDLVFPMIGVWNRNIYSGIEFCKSLASIEPEKVSAEVEARKAAFRGVEIAGKNLAVVGLGQIGVRMSNGGVQRHMNVKGYDPSPALQNIHMLLPEVTITRTLPTVLKDADFVTLHLPLNDRTRGMVDREFISKMKDGAVLINYAREPIVDEDAVLEALDSGKLSCYLSDFPSAKTIGHEKILTTPHLGASTSESEENCATMAVKELAAYLEYGNVVHSVNFPNIESIPAQKVHTRLIVINNDVPGMIAFATNLIGKYGINIESYRNQSNGKVGYNIIDLEDTVPEALLAEIMENENVIRTRTIVF